jgi:hypothetical protein
MVLINIAVVILAITEITVRLLQVGRFNLLYFSITIHKTIEIAEMNMIVKVRLAPVVSAGKNILHMVPSIRTMLNISPVVIPILTAFLITWRLVVKKGYSVLKIGNNPYFGQFLVLLLCGWNVAKSNCPV